MKAIEIIAGFIMGVIGIAALSQVHNGMAADVAALNLSDYHEAEWNMIPLAVFFVMVVGSVVALYDAFRNREG